MMLVLGSCGTSMLSCCAMSVLSALLRAACCACSGAGARVSLLAAKLFYAALLALASALALVLYAYGERIPWLQSIAALQAICTQQSTVASQCYGASAALRVSLATVVWLAANLPLAASGDLFRGLWLPKAAAWLGLVAGAFFVPVDSVASFGAVARVLAVFWLIASIILLIDAAYLAQEWLVARMDERDATLRVAYAEIGCLQNHYRLLYLSAAAALVVAAVAGIAWMLRFSASAPGGCPLNAALLSLSLAAGALLLVLAPLECLGGGGGGVLAPALVFAYIAWLGWSAISVQPDAGCNPTPPDATSTAAAVVGLIIAAISCAYAAFSAARALPHMFDLRPKPGAVATSANHAAEHGDEAAGDTAPLTGPARHGAASSRAAAAAVGSSGEGRDEDEEAGARGAAAAAGSAGAGGVEPHNSYEVVLYLVILALAAAYMGPVVTNWAVDPASVVVSRSSAVAFWVDWAVAASTAGLFLWTLVAPLCFPNRDFR